MAGVPEDLREEVEKMVEHHEMSEHVETDAEAPELLSDELLAFLANRHAVAGPPEYCQQRLRELEDAGVDEFVLHFNYTDDRHEAVERFDEEVLRPLGAGDG